MAYYKKNKKRIDPRYFLNETADRDTLEEKGRREILPAVAAKMSEETTDRLEQQQRSGLNQGPSSPAIDSVDPFLPPGLPVPPAPPVAPVWQPGPEFPDPYPWQISDIGPVDDVGGQALPPESLEEREGGIEGMRKRAEKTKKQMQTSNIPDVGINTKTGKRMMAPDRPDETDENINQALVDPRSQRQNPVLPKRRAFDVLENNGKTSEYEKQTGKKMYDDLYVMPPTNPKDSKAAESIKETIKAALREAFNRKNRK